MLLKDINKSSFQLNYLVYQAVVKKDKQVVWDKLLNKNIEIDILLIQHKFDTMPIMLTIPSIGEDEYVAKSKVLSDYK